MWQLFAEPEYSEDLRRRHTFWGDVVGEAKRDMQRYTQRTRSSTLVSAAYSYLRANFGADLDEAYANLKQAFGVVNDKDFNLLLFCDEARILCDISAIDGKIIPTDLDFSPEREIREIQFPTQTNYFPFSNFQALKQALRYLSLAQSRSESLDTVSVKRRTIQSQ
jgi:hypothetical protein